MEWNAEIDGYQRKDPSSVLAPGEEGG
jgi:hypothetical protein